MVNRNPAATAAYVFLRKEGKLLLARRCNTGWQDGKYQMPAGHVEPGELPSETAIREAKEEVGVDIDPHDLRFMHVGFRGKHDDTGDRVDYYFEATKWSGEVMNCEPEKCDDLLWVAPDDLPDDMVPHARVVIEAVERGETYSEQKQ